MDMLHEIAQLDDEGCLFLSAAIDDWNPILARGIDCVIDLEGGLDAGVPESSDQFLYIYLPIDDGKLPNLHRMHCVAKMAADVIRGGDRVLSHCGMGLNRSALMAALILCYMGMTPKAAVERCRERRRGALYNPIFSGYLLDPQLKLLAKVQ